MAYRYQRWLARELRAAGLRVVEIEGWQNRGRPASTGAFDPNGSSTTHHTGPYSDVSSMLRLLVAGRSDLPGPLCQVATGPDGTVYVIAAGRANHAGRVGKGGQPGMPYGADGNALAIGNEVITNGTSPLPKAQRDAIAVVNQVVTRHFKRSRDWAHRHADISGTGKWDIGQLSTTELRRDMATVKIEEDDVSAADVWNHKLPTDAGPLPARVVLRRTLGQSERGRIAAQAALAQANRNRAAIEALGDRLEAVAPGVAQAVRDALGEEITLSLEVQTKEDQS